MTYKLPIKIRAFACVLIALPFALLPAGADAQSACAQLGVNCHTNISSGPPPRPACDANCWAQRREWARERAEQRRQAAAQRRAWKASNNNNRGVAEFNKGNYAKALRLFKSANSLHYDSVYAQNIDIARQRLQNQAAEKQAARQQRAAAKQLAAQQKAEAKAAAAEARREAQQAEAARKLQAKLARENGASGATGTAPAGGDALMEARVAAASSQSAACILDGSTGCTAPVPLVEIGAGDPPLPADSAAYVKELPAEARKDPEVKRNLDMYEHFASVRGEAQQQLIADVAVAKAHPGDENAKMKVMEDTGNLNGAAKDEQQAKTRLSFSIAKISEQGSAGTQSGSGSKP